MRRTLVVAITTLIACAALISALSLTGGGAPAERIQTIAPNTAWMDTSIYPAQLKIYDGQTWLDTNICFSAENKPEYCR